MNDLTVIEQEFGPLADLAPDVPDFWLAQPAESLPFIESLKQADVRTIGQTAGGRVIHAIEYGEKEELDDTCNNFASCLASSVVPPSPIEIFPKSYYGHRRRTKPSLVIQGAIHGGEITGTVAALNLCHIIETGEDLRGKAWPELAELARDMRLTIIPWLNRDGCERNPFRSGMGLSAEIQTRCLQGVACDGTKYTYPEVKSIFPIPPEETAFMGAYYNDAGVNLQYDFATLERQPETQTWMRYYLSEKPDAVLICHCNAGSLMGPPPYFLPEGHQHEFSRLAGAVRQRLLREGFDAGRMSWAGLPGMGKPGFSQISAVYEACGAMPIMCEFPNGGAYAPMTHEAMLDLSLIVFEETLFFAHHDGLRPYECWDKVRANRKREES